MFPKVVQDFVSNVILSFICGKLRKLVEKELRVGEEIQVEN